MLCACSSAVAFPATSIQRWESGVRQQHSDLTATRSLWACCSSHSCSSNIIGPCWISHRSSPTPVTILLSNEPLPRCHLTCCCQNKQILDYSFSNWKREAGCILSDSRFEEFWSLGWVDQRCPMSWNWPDSVVLSLLRCPFFKYASSFFFLRFIRHVQLCFLKSYTSVDLSVSALKYQKVYLCRYCRSVALVYCWFGCSPGFCMLFLLQVGQNGWMGVGASFICLVTSSFNTSLAIPGAFMLCVCMCAPAFFPARYMCLCAW